MENKTTKKQLIKMISDDIIVYLRSGKISINEYLKDINKNIIDLKKLLYIHFLLDDRVRNYIMYLNKNICSLNTSIKKKESLYRGKLKGNVSWGKTIQNRYNINPKDKSIFVCNENIKNYNTKENIVLKKCLQIIYNLFQDCNINRYFKYEWFKDGQELRKCIEDIYRKNIYLNRIELNSKNIDDRIIEDVYKNRNRLYKEAAYIVKFYNKINNLDKEELRRMFQTTFLEIADEATLFELFWVLEIIKRNSKNAKLYVLDEKNSKVAEWENNNNIYTIYHNSSGSDDINFSVKLDEIKGLNNTFIKKQIKVVEDTNFIAKRLFNGISERYSHLFSGRPDIVLEIRNKDNKKLSKIILGEVKYTCDIDYSIQGLKELIEYMNFIKIKINNNYNYVQDQIIIEGMLFLDKIKVNSNNVNDIKINTIDDMNNLIIMN